MLEVDLEYDWESFHAHYQVNIGPGMTTLLGASGEGKSTLLHLIGGFLKGRGKILFQSQSLLALPAYKRPISTLFQSDNLFPQLTVWQNVAVGISPSLKLTAEQKERVVWALEQTQLQEKANQYPQNLSGGQAQRVAIARVLVRNKPILLLDEPFSALDPALRESMLMLVSDMTERFQLTTLLVSHNPSEAEWVGGQVILIQQGHILEHAPASILSCREKSKNFSRYFSLSQRSTTQIE